jgi:GNAT superfamily N-acetyltransferase
MPLLALAPCVDLAVFYAADSERFAGTGSATLQVVTPAVFIGFYRNCPSIGFLFDGQPIGGIIFDGVEAHIAVLPAFRGRWALLLKPALDWLFSLKAEIVVNIEANNAICLAFMERNGWKRLRSDGQHVTYLMTPQGGARKTAHHFAPASRRDNLANGHHRIRTPRRSHRA